MLRQAALAAALFGLSALPTSAQTPNPVLQHFRAYQVALDSNDLAVAEQEAAAAWAASEARDGDGGRTAVLAFNLASVRFLRGDAAGAVEPGRRALTISQASGEAQAGVSPILAQLIVSRVELAAGVAGAADQLESALESALQARLDPGEIYDAAIELGTWTFQNGQFGRSRQAWSIAADYAEGARFGEPYARATSLTAEAAALLLEDLDGRPRSRLSGDAARDAHAMLHEALRILCPLAEMNSDGEVTRAQQAYARALAWSSILHAKLRSDGQEIPEIDVAQGDADGLSEVDIPTAPASQPRCLIRLRLRDGDRLYPESALNNGSLGGVAARFRINAEGEIEDVQALAVVGPEEFGESVERRQRNWRVTLHEDSPPNCRMAMSVIRSISFQIGGN